MAEEKKLVELSMDFSVALLEMTKDIKGHFSIINQLERAGTSIGANIHESNYAQSGADFVSKLHIALKECYETEYWLKLIMRTQIAKECDVRKLLNDCGIIRRKLISSVKTVKEK